MYLLLDIGNTRAKAAIVKHGKVSALPQLAPDNLSNLPIQAVYFACVNTYEKVEELKLQLQLSHLPWRQVSSEARAYGVVNSYDKPTSLGVDRWLALLGSQLLLPNESVLIVDAGTAVTLDWIDKNGVHGGGWIIPGLKMQQQAVVSNTAKVINSEVFNGRMEPGKDTVTGLQNGCLASVVGAIHTAFKLYQFDKVIITGGDTKFIKPYLTELPIVIEPLLVFHGLARYIDM